MTRRERLERKLEKREEWADGRDSKAAGLRTQNDKFRGDHAFNTQPGHIPERARANRRDEKAYEHSQMAGHHRSKAAGLEHQLEKTIFSDDTDAIQALEAKIAKMEANRDKMKATNKIIRRKPKNEITPEKLQELAPLAGSESIARMLFTPDFAGRVGIPSYALTNLGANIRRCKERIKEIESRNARQVKAEEAGGVLIHYFPEAEGTASKYCAVTFAEKPDYSVIKALKAAGFMWGGGNWGGQTANLPEVVRGMLP